MNGRKQSRRNRRRRETVARWMASEAWKALVFSGVEPAPSAWGRWTPPARWIQRQRMMARMRNAQTEYLRTHGVPTPPPVTSIEDFTGAQIATIAALTPAWMDGECTIVTLSEPEQT